MEGGQLDIKIVQFDVESGYFDFDSTSLVRFPEIASGRLPDDVRALEQILQRDGAAWNHGAQLHMQGFPTSLGVSYFVLTSIISLQRFLFCGGIFQDFLVLLE